MLISITNLIKESYDLYAKNAKLFFFYAFLISLPSMTVGFLGSIVAALFNLKSLSFLTILYAGVFFILGVISYFITLWLTAAFIKIVAATITGTPAQSPKEEIMASKKFILPVLIISILSGLAVLGGFILLIIPGIIFSVWFAFSIYAVILDNQKDTDAMRFSKKLSTGRWFDVFLRILIPALIVIVLSGVLQLPFSLLAKSSQSVAVNNILSIAASFISIALTPFMVSAQTILYINLKKTQKTGEFSV